MDKSPSGHIEVGTSGYRNAKPDGSGLSLWSLI
jgi:hypothetical protein